MLPAYKNLASTRAYFREVEVEERADSSELQPDCVGITEEGLRIHVEIYVTHKIDERKKEKIEKNAINCVEIRIPNVFPLDREQLKDFIENQEEGRTWINYPYGDVIHTRIEKERQEKFIQEKKERALWYMKYKRNMLKIPMECNSCEVKPLSWERCIHHIEDIEYEGKEYIVCDFKPAVIETTKSPEIKPNKSANVGFPTPVERKNITMEQYRKDMDNDICPLCGARIVKRNGPYGEYWRCVNSNCKWTWN